MILFDATYWDGSQVDILDSDGATITMQDNSDYDGETGLTQSATANTIVLALDAEGDTQTYYNGCVVTITSGTSEGAFAYVPMTGNNFVVSTKAISNISWVGGTPDGTSVYSITQHGHAQSDFSTLRKVKLTLPDATTYLFSSIGDGDASTVVAEDQTLPLTDTYTYSQGDGVYAVKLSTVPDFNSNINCIYTPGMCVYYTSKYYECIVQTTGADFPTDTTYWTEITLDTLPVKYTDSRTFVIDYDLSSAYAQAAYKARCGADHPCNTKDILNSNAYENWAMLDLYLYSLQTLVNKEAWNEVTDLINSANEMTAYNE